MASSIAVPAAQSVKFEFLVREEEHVASGTLLGFWLYLMSDCLIFAALFATYGVLSQSYAGGPTGADLFDLPLVALNTSFLLVSSITYGFAMLQMQQGKLSGTMLWLGITGILGVGFLGLEIYEFYHLIQLGAWTQTSGFLSAFFALVGTHGLHVVFGILWLVILLVQLRMYGLTGANRRRLFCLSMFWHFLDVIWIGVFTIVYLMGSMS